jgi:hypothetical protein
MKSEAILFGIITGSVIIGSAVVGSVAVTTMTHKQLTTEKLNTAKKEKEVELLKNNIEKMQDFMEWDLQYMQDKINLNMIELGPEDLHRFGEKELREVREKTKEYAEKELLPRVKSRVEETRKLLKEHKTDAA